MKYCKYCDNELPVSDFNFNGRTPNGSIKYKPFCKSCEKVGRDEMKNNKIKLIIERFGNSCTVCGYDRSFAALEFHHLDPTTKENHPSNLINSHSTVTRMMKELDKCKLSQRSPCRSYYYLTQLNGG